MTMKLKPKGEIKQRHLEAWERLYQENGDGVRGVSRMAGLTVRSAIEAEWFINGVEVDDVDESSPVEIRRIAGDIDKRYTDIITIPKKS